MTQFAQSYYEEKMEAINATRIETLQETQEQIAKSLLSSGMNYIEVMKHTRLSREDVRRIQDLLEAKGA